MSKQISVSIIVPVYNAESHIKRCFDVLLKQDFKESVEIIMVDDASTDNSVDLIKKYNVPNLSLYRLESNSGASAARNVGLKKAIGEYVYLMDVDDTISVDALKTLYAVAKQNDCDFVFSDFKRILNSENQRNNTYNYPADKVFEKNDLLENMQKEIRNPSAGHLGLFGCNGRLIRRTVISNNNIFFVDKLRYLEDKTFCWDLFGIINSARYIHKQLYFYHIYPNVPSAVNKSIDHGFEIEYFKFITKRIQSSFQRFGLSSDKIEKLVDQGLIFYIITLLVSYSRSMAMGKVKKKDGTQIRRKFINGILADPDVLKAIKNYSPSNKESQWIPKAISLRSRLLLEFACNLRAKQVVKIRNKGKE